MNMKKNCIKCNKIYDFANQECPYCGEKIYNIQFDNKNKKFKKILDTVIGIIALVFMLFVIIAFICSVVDTISEINKPPSEAEIQKIANEVKRDEMCKKQSDSYHKCSYSKKYGRCICKSY